MADVMKIGGKAPNNTVKGIMVDSDGYAETRKKWDNSIVDVYTMETLVTSTAAIVAPAVDVSDCGAFSLRIRNTTDVRYKINFYSDIQSSSTLIMSNMDGNTNAIYVPRAPAEGAGLGLMMATPDDYPFMQWIRNVHLRIEPLAVPTQGTLFIKLIKKR